MVTARKLGASTLFVEQGVSFRSGGIEVVERKGWGHPDKLADDLAECLSREYARRCQSICGAILHHNFDKLCLLGGESTVSYGHGEMTKPIRALINGRASLSFGGTSLQVENLITETCRRFFAARLPLLNPETDIRIELNISTASSPGRVFNNQGSTSRHCWFNPSRLEDLPERARLHANDTSIGTGYAPLSTVERLVKSLSDHLSARPRPSCPSWMGTDVKVMACGNDRGVDVIACVPQIARHVAARDDYRSNTEWLKKDIETLIGTNFPGLSFNLLLNGRDNIDTDEVYLTAIGSSIESGDEGLVGRGNRVNGLITPMRPMNIEGANGKNPVYHVGKLYNVVANHIASDLHTKFGGFVAVNLVSCTGADLIAPWRIIVQMEKSDLPLHELERVIGHRLGGIPIITEAIVAGEEMLS